jgi:hypothetical protein
MPSSPAPRGASVSATNGWACTRGPGWARIAAASSGGSGLFTGSRPGTSPTTSPGIAWWTATTAGHRYQGHFRSSRFDRVSSARIHTRPVRTPSPLPMPALPATLCLTHQHPCSPSASPSPPTRPPGHPSPATGRAATVGSGVANNCCGQRRSRRRRPIGWCRRDWPVARSIAIISPLERLAGRGARQRRIMREDDR